MEEKNGDAKTFWMELQDDGKVDLMFEKTQNVLHSLKQKIKDGSATNGDYVQAMNLVNEATLSNAQTLEKDHTPVTQSEQENKSSAVPSASCDNSCPKGCTVPSPGKNVFLPVKIKADNLVKKEAPVHISFHRHICSRTCLMETPLSLKGENPLQLPVRCHFQRRHAKTNSHSSALHVNYKTPCGRNLRNMEEVFHYLLETECNFLFTDNFSFNTYVQLTRNHPKQNEVVSDVDISNGVESVSIPFCNEIDNSKLPRFKYRNTVWPRIYHLNFSNMFSDSCDCSEGCIDIKKCACLQLTAKNAKACPLSSDGECAGYKYKRLQRLIPTGIYECNLLCKCNKQMCQNRVIQHGVRVRLQVFKSEKKGWGVRCLDDIDKGTFVCIYSGRLLRRATPEKTNIGENGREQQHIVKNSFSKKRKLEVVCSDCDAHCDSPKAEDCPPKLSGDLKEPAVEMNHRNISRTQHHSVIRRTKSKTTVFHYSEKNMGFVCSDSAAPEDKNGFKPAQEHVNSEARRAHEDLSSNPVGDSEDKQLTESDVIDITASREDSSPAYRCKHATIVDSKDTKQVLEVPVKKSQEEEPAASQSQQALCNEELPSERTNIPSASLMQLSKESLFLLDASKEGNVGRFLNHSCCPNLWVQNVFVETHDRNFPLVAFFTNRYVKARTELTWDYGYEAGTMPVKEILCQCFCQLTEKMEKRTCALCPEGHDWSVIYFVPSANIAAHENCLLYSSGLVECEAHNPCKIARNVDVKSVLERIWRGSTMICSFCNNEGAIVRCGETSCAKNYHLFCAKEDYAVLQGGVTRTYKLFCPEHPPQQEEATESADGPSMKRKRGRKKRLSSGPPAQPKVVKFMRSKRHVTGEPLGHRDAAVKAPFLKKCKKAGLLNVLLEYILEKMNSIYGRLLDETASESDCEGIETLLFDCGLFKDTLRKFQEVIKSKACEWEERQRQMKQQLEALADLQQSLCSYQENGDLDSSSSTSGSLLPPEDHQVRCQESPEVQAGSGDSL